MSTIAASPAGGNDIYKDVVIKNTFIDVKEPLPASAIKRVKSVPRSFSAKAYTARFYVPFAVIVQDGNGKELLRIWDDELDLTVYQLKLMLENSRTDENAALESFCGSLRLQQGDDGLLADRTKLRGVVSRAWSAPGAELYDDIHVFAEMETVGGKLSSSRLARKKKNRKTSYVTPKVESWMSSCPHCRNHGGDFCTKAICSHWVEGVCAAPEEGCKYCHACEGSRKRKIKAPCDERRVLNLASMLPVMRHDAHLAEARPSEAYP